MSNLSVGKLWDKKSSDAAVNYLVTLGLLQKSLFGKISGENEGWLLAPENIDDIDLLNIASVNMFLEHVSKIEGINDVNKSIDDSRFKHLPWWMTSIWLPVQFENSKVPLYKDNGFPVFLGSCYELLKNLDEIKMISNANLGNTPPGYEEMRKDLKAFYQSDFSLSEEEHILQWVWKGLYDGATISIEKNAPMWGIE